MAGERKTARELIEAGLRDTERCLSQKQYNSAMIRARQTLEYIVKSLCRRNGVPEGDLSVMIDDLYLQGIISKDSCANYQKIRLLGENAVSRADNNAYNANNAYQLLSQEVYAYQSRAARRERRTNSTPARRSGSLRASAPRQDSGFNFNPFDLLKIVIPILMIILVISVVRLVRADHPKETTAAEVTTEAPAETSTEAPETEAPETAPVMIYTTRTSLNVRSAPSTDAELLTTLPAGTVLDFVGAYNDEWSIINYNGGQAYVSTKYVDVQEQTPGTP